LLRVYPLQVLRRDYTSAADLWSAGVIMYILLSGYPPFGGKSDSHTLQKVQQGSYSFANREVSGYTRRWLDFHAHAASLPMAVQLCRSQHRELVGVSCLNSPDQY
jgi:calcium-dependent protein kinase